MLPPNVEVDNSLDLTLIKHNSSSPPPPTCCEQSTQTDDNVTPPPVNNTTTTTTSTDNLIKVKEEPKPPTPPPVKIEDSCVDSDNYNDASNDMADVPSDNSDDMSLITLKRKKKGRNVETNGQVTEKRGRKKKPKQKEWEMLINALPQSTALTMVNEDKESMKLNVVKQEIEGRDIAVSLEVKREPDMNVYNCCICFTQCYSRIEMLQHYRQHVTETENWAEAPAAPPPPDQEPLRCVRCRKVLARGEWAAHWRRHWERDRRPYRCALCEKTFRDPHQILKHGLTHKMGEDGSDSAQPLTKRFVCDLCPEGFVYMRYLLGHRLAAHPEAAGRALLLRCAACGRQFAHLNSLRRHLRAHSGERNFLCNVCGKALSSREHLKFHIRIHTGYKPNVCKTCGKGFVKKCNLTLHERVHSGEKPHVCSHCGKAFSQRSTLVIHERYHSGARPYVCGLCGRGFVAKGLLSMHLKTTCI
ncbi:zinc finger protein 250-like isoform X2 [Galleria mellonella]|nr:zinc finger protein 250-like isoform X2 [Galleria mellonella]XP_052758240.1 zinc finger protein 250-like isoform X2 [Galleria mellonella]XP_052758241.1 zinc finger protein 250-like isoform X2 [Galleria mellonella]